MKHVIQQFISFIYTFNYLGNGRWASNTILAVGPSSVCVYVCVWYFQGTSDYTGITVVNDSFSHVYLFKLYLALPLEFLWTIPNVLYWLPSSFQEDGGTF